MNEKRLPIKGIIIAAIAVIVVLALLIGICLAKDKLIKELDESQEDAWDAYNESTGNYDKLLEKTRDLKTNYEQEVIKSSNLEKENEDLKKTVKNWQDQWTVLRYALEGYSVDERKTSFVGTIAANDINYIVFRISDDEFAVIGDNVSAEGTTGFRIRSIANAIPLSSKELIPCYPAITSSEGTLSDGVYVFNYEGKNYELTFVEIQGEQFLALVQH